MMDIVRENSSSPETCNNGVCSTTSPGEMISVRTCYCKEKENAARKKDNVIIIRNKDRHSATGVSEKSIVTSRNRRSGNSRGSCNRARCVTNEKTPDTNRSIEAQPSNPVFSPETSTALENAEKIINNAKIQLMEVCATSSFDSARRNRNTYSDEPPLDDETEERLYVRELVSSKFHDACSSRLSETKGKASARSEKQASPCVTVRRVDLSAPKFRMSRRRRADWTSLGYGTDDRSRGSASPVQLSPSRDSIEVADETTTRDDRARDRRRASSARENGCKIQIGPSVNIVDRELTRQDLEDVHISPESSRAQSRAANIATYTLRHHVVRNANDSEGVPKTRCVRLDTLQREKSTERPIIEATEAVLTDPACKSEQDLGRVRNSDSGRDDERIESPKVRMHGQEKRDRKSDPQDAEGIFEYLRNADQGAVRFAVIETPRTDGDEKSNNKARNENHEEITSGGGDRTENGGIFRKGSGADCLRNEENTVDKIQPEENRSDRSRPSLANDTSRKTAFPQRGNTALRCRKAESSILYQTIDGHFSHVFNSHNGQNGPSDTVNEDALHRSLARAENNLDDQLDLYRPRLDDLDSILYSNDRGIERAVRVAKNLSELLSGPELAIYKSDKDVRVNNETLCRDSSADKDDGYSFALSKPVQSSSLEIELRNDNLTVSEIPRADEDSTGTKSSARGNDSRSDCSVESSVFPVSDASEDSRTPRDSDKAERSAKSSMDRSDVTTLSNLVPALSSTRTETRMCHPREVEFARSSRKLSKRETRHSGKECIDEGIFAGRKDMFQATDQFVAYILPEDEKRNVEGKIASSLKESTVTPAMVQKLLDHLREAESIRDARQTETLDILRNILIKGQSDQGNTNDKETSSRNVPPSARTKAPSIDESTLRVEEARASEIGWVAKNSHEPGSPGGRSCDLSECRETRESVRSTARCESTRYSENNTERETGQMENVSIDVKNEPVKDVNENVTPEERRTLPPNVTGPSIRTNATEETILRTRAKSIASETELIAGKSKDSGNPGRCFFVSPAFPEAGVSARSAAHFEFARESKNNSGNNSKGTLCSEAESLRQISDIRSDDDENLEENPGERLSARSRGGCEVKAADSVIATAAVSENKRDDIKNERLEEDKSNDTRPNEDANKLITDRAIDTRSNVPEAAKGIRSERTHDIATGKKVLFAFSEVSEMKNERVRRSKFIDEAATRIENAGSSRETESDRAAIKKTDPADANCLTVPSRSCIVSSAKSSGSSLRDEQVSLDIGEDNLTRNEEIRESTFAAVENRDGREISRLELKTARSDNERRLIDLRRPRNYKIDVLSSSNSSISSTLLDHDDRSINGTSTANGRRIETTPETSHSEGELYMPSSCSYSLGEVRVLRRKRDLIEDNAMDRDSSVTVLVTRSMLTSLNDSTVSLLGSSGRV